MAEQTEIFDLYYLLVEKIFGSIIGSYLGLAIVFVIMGFLTRMSPQLILTLILMFSLVMGIGYAGAIVAIPIFIASFIYFSFNMVQFIRRWI